MEIKTAKLKTDVRILKRKKKKNTTIRCLIATEYSSCKHRLVLAQ